MYSSESAVYKNPKISKVEVDKTTIILFLIAATFPFLPEVMDKLTELANNTMKSGYKLHIKAGPVNLSLEPGWFVDKGSEDV